VLLSSLLFGHKGVYVEEARKASLERLACLIKVCGFLMQVKIYLFWKAPSLSLSQSPDSIFQLLPTQEISL